MGRVLISSILLLLVAGAGHTTAATTDQKLTIKDISPLSLAAVRDLYNKKKDKTLHVGENKGFSYCELYEEGNKGTCTIQFPERMEIITKCSRVFYKGKDSIKCYATDLLFFFPNYTKHLVAKAE